MALSWDRLSGLAAKESLTAYLCNENFESVKKDVKEDNPDINGNDWKIETMARLLYENLDFKSIAEKENEPDDIHSKNMEKRWLYVDRIAKEWVDGIVITLSVAQQNLDNLIKENI